MTSGEFEEPDRLDTARCERPTKAFGRNDMVEVLSQPALAPGRSIRRISTLGR